MVVGASVAVATRPDLVAAYPWWIAWLAVMTGAWIWGLWQVRGESPPSERRSSTVVWVVAVSAVARLALSVPDAPLSDDLYRYLWDGRVANAGINPFLHAPVAEELAHLRDDAIWPHINHPDVSTIYPATAQLYFRALDALGGDPRSPRWGAALFDTLTVWLLAGMLARRGRSPRAALAFGWCPLAILESGGGGHVDSLGILAMVAALALADVRRPRLFPAGVAFGLSTLVKPMAPLLLPAQLRDRSWRSILALLLGGTLTLALVVPDLDAGSQLFAGFRTYAHHWQFNDAFYSVIVEHGAGPTGTRWVLALGTGLIAWIVGFTVRDRAAAASVVVAVALTLSPTVHPWYVTWLAALLVWAPRSAQRAFLAFVALAPVSYYCAWSFSRTGEWVEPAWLWWISWALPATILTLDRVRTVRSPDARSAERATPRDESAWS
ncbi:MAG: hypothetical protein DHS20C21_06700 [Gemmatimonadota bacterium]|nr:MAG: hypothetical protein DHS20C21_06700 [Gemmatimonadota bacterium]